MRNISVPWGRHWVIWRWIDRPHSSFIDRDAPINKGFRWAEPGVISAPVGA